MTMPQWIICFLLVLPLGISIGATVLIFVDWSIRIFYETCRNQEDD